MGKDLESGQPGFSIRDLNLSYDTSDSEVEQFDSFEVVDVNKDGDAYVGLPNGGKPKYIRKDDTKFVPLHVSGGVVTYVDPDAFRVLGGGMLGAGAEFDKNEKKIVENVIKTKENEENFVALFKLAESSYPEELYNLIQPINEFKNREFSEDQPLLEEDAIRGKYATSHLLPRMKPKRISEDELKLFNYNDLLNSHQSLERTPLMYACLNGHEEVVKMLLAAGSKQKITEKQNGSALNEAARGGHIGVAKILLQHGAKVFQNEPVVRRQQKYSATTYFRNEYCTPLTLACLNDRMDMFRFLVAVSENAEHKPGEKDEFNACLLLACAHGNLEMAKFILDLGIEPNYADPCSKETPYTLAAASGNVELVKCLVRVGARAHYSKHTPLMAAVCNQLTAMVNFLLAQGDCEVNAVFEDLTAFLMACSNGNLSIADKLLTAGANLCTGQPLVIAAKRGHYHMAKYLLRLGIDVDETDRAHILCGGCTALSHAATFGHRKVVELLIDAGANLEHRCDRLETPLMKAARDGHMSTMEFLIKRGAECNTTLSIDGYTSLAICCLGNHIAAVELLLKNGADIFFDLPNGQTVIRILQIHGLSDMMDLFDRFLGENKVKESVSKLARWRLSMYRDDSTPTVTKAMHFQRRIINAFGLACARGHCGLIPTFLERGAKLEHADEKGLTPLVIAALAGQEAVVAAILSILCDYPTVPKRNIFYVERILFGLTPLGAAAFSGHVGIIKLLLEFGADIELPNRKKFDFTPLMLAAASGHVGAVKLLIEKGADVNAMLKRYWQ